MSLKATREGSTVKADVKDIPKTTPSQTHKEMWEHFS